MLSISDLQPAKTDSARQTDFEGSSLPEVYVPRRWRIVFGTVLRLGLINVARAALYRFCKRAGIYRWRAPLQNSRCSLSLVHDSVFDKMCAAPVGADRSVLIEADDLLSGSAKFFSVHTLQIGSPPDWFLNPFRRKRHPNASTHWSQINEFDNDIGDIKTIWEMSRFTWATVFARAFRVSGDVRYLSALRTWIENWWHTNPPNSGPNWICAQESSIRLINALTGLRITGQETHYSPLIPFVYEHCRRIAVTTSYAIAQQNNHATSEAAGLFIGGAWLSIAETPATRKQGKAYAKRGRALLERSVGRLILPDGSFSQHSLTYHRLLLDTLSLVEIWRRSLNQAPFSLEFYRRAAAATRWLAAMIDSGSGDGPNLGSNDGAHPYRLDQSAYRDFRPSLQLASCLFLDKAFLPPGPWDEACAWMGMFAERSYGDSISQESSAVFPHGGYVLLRNSNGVKAILRVPNARFRPSHADALHLDLWSNSLNLLKDGGTYSYAGNDILSTELPSVAGHNVPHLDLHDQMPRLGRFLYGDWLRVSGDASVTQTVDQQEWSGSYVDGWGGRHHRAVSLSPDKLTVTDQLQGFKRSATVRWRLAPGDWRLSERVCTSDMANISIESDVTLRRVALTRGWESRHYLEKSALPVLEIEVDQSPATITTVFELA